MLEPFKKKRCLGVWHRLTLVFLLATAPAVSLAAHPAAAAASGYTLPPAAHLTAVAYGNGTYVVTGTYATSDAPGSGSSVILTSPDGVNWTPIPGRAPFPIGGDVIAAEPMWTLTYGNGAFIDTQGNQFATSPDGSNWQMHDLDWVDLADPEQYSNVNGAVYGNGLYVLIGVHINPSTQTAGDSFVITSPDAAQWTMTRLQDVDQLDQLESIAIGNGSFVATGADGGLLTSGDGVHWTAVGTVELPTDSGILQQMIACYGKVAYCHGRFLALGNRGLISTSPDGLHWTNSRSAYQAVFTVGQSGYLVNGQTQATDAAPFIKDGLAFVPVRYLSDALGVDDVEWSPSTRTVYLTRATASRTGSGPSIDFGVSMIVGSTRLTFHGSDRALDDITRMMNAPPLIKDGRTYLPARYVAEAFGYTVAWNPADRTVTIK